MSQQQLNQWEEAVNKISARNTKGVDDELRKAYAKALRNIKAEVKRAIEDYDSLSFSQKMETDRLIETAKQVQNEFNNAMQEANTSIHQHKAKMVEIGYYGEWYASEAANKIEVDLPVLNKAFVEELVYNEVNAQRLSSRLYKNTRKVADAATDELVQGIIRGDGYRQIGARIQEKTEATYYQATRIARTEGAQSQSSAKQYEYEQEKELGIEATKSWLATLDQRTRHTHAVMDGQTVGIEEEFTLPGGAKTIAPGLSGIAKEDIHCRCTMRKNTDGIPAEFRRDNETGETISNMSYEEWAKMKGYPLPSEQIGQRKARDLQLRDKQAEEIKKTERVFADLRNEPIESIYKYTNDEEFLKTLTLDEREAIRHYVGAAYNPMNRYLRKGKEYLAYLPQSGLDRVEKDIADLTTAIRKTATKRPLKTFRVVDDIDYFNLDIEAGKTRFVESGFLSTTPMEKKSVFWKDEKWNSYAIEIDVPEGTPAIWLGELGQTQEHELILAPGTTLEFVEDLGKHKNQHRIRMRVVPEDE